MSASRVIVVIRVQDEATGPLQAMSAEQQREAIMRLAQRIGVEVVTEGDQ